ncbi:MAG: DUF488 domain-containing protein [Planctomycetales bacterium]|nr:DUF488 domain-containing protein [Planctomycetales bacterium]
MVEFSRSQPGVILTIGHSNRPIEDFVELLTIHGIQLLADVRKMPGSRANPQFGGAALENSLRAVHIDYVHLPGLGGLRRGTKDSPNGGWRNASFRAFADYMLTPEFEASLAELIARAADSRTAIMCAEAVPWRCHRSLIADALVVRGITVEHIMTKARTDKHSLRDWAKVDGSRLTYPPEELPLFATAEEKK